jgi:catechol 2,3-dioxygenase-like lactoylglutathione lyase family enzyme
LKAYGVATERIPAGDLLETGERVRFQIPTGHQIELYATKKMVGNGLDRATRRPGRRTSDGPRHRAVRLDHALLYGPDVDGVLDLFTEVLGFNLTEYVTLPDSDEKGALWLSCSNKAHDIAFVVHPEPAKLHHVSFLLESWDKVLRAADIMSVNDIGGHRPHAPRHHPRRHDLRLGPVGQPLRDLHGRHRALSRLAPDRLDLGRPGRRRRPGCGAPQAARNLPDRGDLITHAH